MLCYAACVKHAKCSFVNQKLTGYEGVKMMGNGRMLPIVLFDEQKKDEINALLNAQNMYIANILFITPDIFHLTHRALLLDSYRDEDA